MTKRRKVLSGSTRKRSLAMPLAEDRGRELSYEKKLKIVVSRIGVESYSTRRNRRLQYRGSGSRVILREETEDCSIERVTASKKKDRSSSSSSEQKERGSSPSECQRKRWAKKTKAAML